MEIYARPEERLRVHISYSHAIINVWMWEEEKEEEEMTRDSARDFFLFFHFFRLLSFRIAEGNAEEFQGERRKKAFPQREELRRLPRTLRVYSAIFRKKGWKQRKEREKETERNKQVLRANYGCWVVTEAQKDKPFSNRLFSDCIYVEIR